MKSTSEQWKGVACFPNYEVSSHGRVRNRTSGRMLSPFIQDKYGHKAITLCNKGQKIQKHVHRLVLYAFVGSPPKGMECRHLDGNAANNNVGNLCWGTRKENIADSMRHGTHAVPDHRGEANGGAKLTTAEVIEIRRIAPFTKTNIIALRFGVTENNVTRIIRREGWRHV